MKIMQIVKVEMEENRNPALPRQFQQTFLQGSHVFKRQRQLKQNYRR